MQSVNKADLIQRVSVETGLTKAAAERAVNAVTSGIADAMAQGGKVTLVGFGSFQVVSRAERQGRNPQTGEAIKIEARKTVKFKPGSELQSRVNG